MVDGSGREIDRTAGLQSAAELARFYKAAAAKAQPPVNSNAHAGSRRRRQRGGRRQRRPDERRTNSGRKNSDATIAMKTDADEPSPRSTNPKPWETVVRIRVLEQPLDRLRLGYDHPQHARGVAHPDLCATSSSWTGGSRLRHLRFPRKIMIDLFDGNLTGTKPAKVHFLEAVEGWAVDYDFIRDVGLIRIKPGRRLPACRVVPAHWQPQPRMQVLTVGCSEGHDATAWHTMITKSRIQNFLQGNPTYEAIECDVAPKQGRSGGGLFTDDGYMAGVCNFAEPQGDHGLYATPRSIYKLLDRNNLMALYCAGVARVRHAAGRQASCWAATAQGRRSPSPAPSRQTWKKAIASRGGSDGEELVVPHPSRLGIPQPINAQTENSPRPASNTTRRIAWQPRPVQRAEPTDLNLDPAADHDRFGPFPGNAQPQQDAGARADGASSSIPGSNSGSRWHRVKAEPLSDATATAGK